MRIEELKGVSIKQQPRRQIVGNDVRSELDWSIAVRVEPCKTVSLIELMYPCGVTYDEHDAGCITSQTGLDSMAIPIPKPLEIDVPMYRQHIRQVRATEEQKRAMRRALDNWQRITKSGQITERRLRPIVEAAKSRFAAVWIMGGAILASLVHTFPAAKEAFREIMRTGNASQRWHMVANLRHCKDRKVCRGVVKGVIDDRAATVRERAAVAADRLRLTQLVAALKNRREVEQSKELIETLDFRIAMLTDEYLLEPGPSDERRLYLTIRHQWGWRTILIDPEDVASGRIPQIVRREQKKKF